MRTSRCLIVRLVVTAAVVFAIVVGAPQAAPSQSTPTKSTAAKGVTAVPRPAPDLGLLAGLKVRAIGPAGMSGRIAAIEADPNDPRVVYVGAATGGVWKSTNGGITFSPIFDDQPVHAIGAIAVSPANPAIVWVGTGEGNVRNSASVGQGVYRSLDAGKTWTHLGLAATERIHRIVLHPRDPQIAWVAALGRAWGENPERGVYKTTDGGASWRRVLFVDERTGASELVIDPSNPNKLLASLWTFRRWPYFFRSGGPGSGLYASSDGGETWERRQEEDGLPKGVLGRIGLALCQSQPQVVYALVEAEKSALLRSEDGGATFQTVNGDVNIAPRPFYFADLRVDPLWPQRVYTLHYGVEVSNDGGKSFARLPATERLHGDYHALWIDPRDGRRLYFGDDGGVGVSDDRGQTARHVAGLPLAQFYHVAVDDQVPYRVMGGLQDNGSWLGPSSVWEFNGIRSSLWRFAGFGDGFDVQPVDGSRSEVYSMSQAGYLQRYDTETGAQRWIRPPDLPGGPRLRFNWNAGLAVDPDAAGTIYYGSQFVHRSRDRGETWEVISGDLTTNTAEWQRQSESGGLTPDVTGAENFGTLIAIAPSPRRAGVIWTGSDDGRLHVTQDGGKSWTSVEKNLTGAPAGAWIPMIEPSPHDPAAAFVVLDDHRRSNLATYLFVTRDYGKTWRRIADPARNPELRGYALAVRQDLVEPELIFLGTEWGLWISFDGGERFAQFKHGLPTASVMDLVIHPREHDLVIATHGRALYILDDLRPLRAVKHGLPETLTLFEPPAAIAWQPAAEPGGFASGHDTFYGENRPRGAWLSFAASGEDLPLPDPKAERVRQQRARDEAPRTPWGPYAAAPAAGEPKPAAGEAKPAAEDKPPQAMVEVRDPEGRIVRHFKTPVARGLNRFVWDLSRDDFKRPPANPGETPEEFPAGPQVVPGTYSVTLRRGEQEARIPVKVALDPRLPRTSAEIEAWEQAIGRWGAARERLVGLIDQLGRWRTDIDAAFARRDRDRLQARGRHEIEPEPPPKDELRERWTTVAEQLKQHESTLWRGPDSKGLTDDSDLYTTSFFCREAIGSTYAAPSAGALERIAAFEGRVGAAEVKQRELATQQINPLLERIVEAKLPLVSP